MVILIFLFLKILIVSLAVVLNESFRFVAFVDFDGTAFDEAAHDVDGTAFADAASDGDTGLDVTSASSLGAASLDFGVDEIFVSKSIALTTESVILGLL